MLHSSSNRATPTGETITKLVRQHYKPEPKQVYSHEKVQCRTDITCQKSKPDDYWTTNYRRRQANMQRGFYSSSKEPYKPIGGQLILDPCELVLSAVPGTVDKKINTRTRRRGTIYEEQKIETKPSGKEKTDDGSDSFTSLDLVDNAPTGGYDDIKKLLKESNQRIICLRAGSWYEDHVKTVEGDTNDSCKLQIHNILEHD
ncbi:uncharacterized protein LOC128546148 [Mercenaria mercenaria]|uniref:uncharacterized protein LOC128546148 n=1 Tax=Mercenaria mercenaria TaxID=6596 RepID=UPI00234F7E80|nr:uncharacterized protein LOC128546148 [Mercenaria mercenaria]